MILNIKLTYSNDPLFTSQIVIHFVTHFVTENDKVQFDCPVALNMYKMTYPN
jgi:hypothetical protein